MVVFCIKHHNLRLYSLHAKLTVCSEEIVLSNLTFQLIFLGARESVAPSGNLEAFPKPVRIQYSRDWNDAVLAGRWAQAFTICWDRLRSTVVVVFLISLCFVWYLILHIFMQFWIYLNLDQWFLTFFTYLTFFRTRLPDLSPILSNGAHLLKIWNWQTPTA